MSERRRPYRGGEEFKITDNERRDRIKRKRLGSEGISNDYQNSDNLRYTLFIIITGIHYVCLSV